MILGQFEPKVGGEVPIFVVPLLLLDLWEIFLQIGRVVLFASRPLLFPLALGLLAL